MCLREILGVCVLAAGLAATPGGRTVAGQEQPFAARLKAVLGIKGSGANYLPPLAKAVSILEPAVRRGIKTHPRAASAAFRLATPYLDQVVTDINKGAPAALLRNKILATVNLHGEPAGPAARHWLYGNTLTRLDILSGWFPMMIRNAIAARQWIHAASLERARLILTSQEAEWAGPQFTLYGFSAGSLRTKPNRRKEFDRMLGEKCVADLGRMWGEGQAQSAPWDSAFNGFIGMTQEGVLVDPRGIPKRAPIPAAMVRRVMRYLRRAIHSAVRTDLQWRLLNAGALAWCIHHYSLAGHTRFVERMASALGTWAAQVKKQQAMPALERHALLRWIKEALPP